MILEAPSCDVRRFAPISSVNADAEHPQNVNHAQGNDRHVFQEEKRGSKKLIVIERLDADDRHEPVDESGVQQPFQRAVQEPVQTDHKNRDLGKKSQRPVAFQLDLEAAVPARPEIFPESSAQPRSGHQRENEKEQDDPGGLHDDFHPKRGTKIVPHLDETKRRRDERKEDEARMRVKEPDAPEKQTNTRFQSLLHISRHGQITPLSGKCCPFGGLTDRV